MRLELIGVKDAGDIDNERVVIIANDDDDLNNYMIVDNTFNEEGEPSNKHRHLYKFPSKKVSKGDIIVLYTKKGKDNNQERKDGAIQHNFYWNSQNTIWNKGRDKCHLIRIVVIDSIDVE